MKKRPLADVTAAVVLVGLFWVLPTAAAEPWPRTVAGGALAAVTATVMVLRRRFPFGATLTAGVATLLGSLLGVCQDPMLATAWCLYPLAIERAARTGRVVAVLAGLFGVLAAVTGVPEGAMRDLGEHLVVAIAALGGAWLLGTTAGRQILSAQETERARVQLAVARDVHDVVGHALGVIVAEAGVTLSLPDAAEPELRGTLAGVESHARAALTDVQALVRTLRNPETPSVPGLAALPSLIATTKAAGVRVDARLHLDDRIGPAAGAVLFRIVQEALTNVVRHAPGAACIVDLHTEKEAVVARIDNDRALPRPGAGAAPGNGLGLAGMRERAALIGGTVTWGARPDGGFSVCARLPCESGR